MIRKTGFSLIIILFSLYSCLTLPGAGEGLTIAGIQLNINRDIYNIEESFYNHIDQILSELTPGIDLVVFPEYTGVFLAIMPYSGLLQNIDDFETGFSAILTETGILTYYDFFIESSTAVDAIMKRVWGALAIKYNITIVAGSAFIVKELENGKKELRNRCYVFNPKGVLVYIQDKVFLTDFESKLIGLAPGQIENAVPFIVESKKIVLTICRDTYFSDWSQHQSGADLWIDIKANGVPFTNEIEDSFDRALPLRLIESDVPYGLTVCLTGEYFHFYWEGISSLIRKNDDGIDYLKSTSVPDKEDYIIYSIRFNE